MVDISLCNGKGCDRTERCMRCRSLYKASSNQSYIDSTSCIESNYSAYWEVNQPNPTAGQFRTCNVYIKNEHEYE
jgi:hypothetical protein